MHVRQIAESRRVPRPRYAWLGVVLEIATGILAIPVGIIFLTDPTGASMGLPPDWIRDKLFGSYTIPGLYLVAMNGLGMLTLAGLTAIGHRMAPWLTGVLGVGLIIWILVQLAVMPETMILQPVFLAVGVALGFIALFWLRRTGQLRLW